MKRRVVVTFAALVATSSLVLMVGAAAGPPATIVTWAGTPQSTAVNSDFPVALQAVVRDSSGNGVEGSSVTFTAPSTGASATFNGSSTTTVSTDGSGIARPPTLRANGIGGSFVLTASVSGVTGTAQFALTNTGGGGAVAPPAPSNLRIMSGGPGPASSVTAASGSAQSAIVNTSFGLPLQARVSDAAANPLSGITVTFTAPSGGATARFNGSATATAITGASGVAVSPIVTATGTTGSYTITATVVGVPASASFNMTNTSSAPPANGSWTSVTPASIDLDASTINGCSNFGAVSVVAAAGSPGTLFAMFTCRGLWKSTDYGRTWTGPIDGGRVSGGLAAAPGVLYSGGMSGSGIGFWRSTDGGVTWTNYPITPAPSGRQDMYAPVVDPYDGNHLLMAGHEQDLLVESVDGGQHWTNVPMAAGMRGSGTAFLHFVNTGNASTTRRTWLWTPQGTGGNVGTWRTTDGGNSWTKVDNNEHAHGNMQFYQPDTSGVIYMPGDYSALGSGLLRSTDYGQTWTHVGAFGGQSAVFGTPNRVYGMYAWACAHCNISPAFQTAPQPGVTGWASAPTPASMTMGAAQAAVVFDGSRYIIVTANWTAGLWRYVE